jgi:hypothetical protein
VNKSVNKVDEAMREGLVSVHQQREGKQHEPQRASAKTN